MRRRKATSRIRSVSPPNAYALDLRINVRPSYRIAIEKEL
jgi:hypothetical protein